MAREAIFIGYRREDTADAAGRLYDALTKRFGRKSVFKDVDNISPGTDFIDHVRSLLPRCQVMLVLIGPSWLSARDAAGRSRLDDPNDLVRIEIETALAAPHVNVVPVLVSGAQLPRAEDLPASVQPLLRRHAAHLRRDPDFQGDVSRLTESLTAKLPAVARRRRSRQLAIAVVLALLASFAWLGWNQLESPPVRDNAITASTSHEVDGAAGQAQPGDWILGQWEPFQGSCADYPVRFIYADGHYWYQFYYGGWDRRPRGPLEIISTDPLVFRSPIGSTWTQEEPFLIDRPSECHYRRAAG